jgi:hypothetical protein
LETSNYIYNNTKIVYQMNDSKDSTVRILFAQSRKTIECWYLVDKYRAYEYFLARCHSDIYHVTVETLFKIHYR